MLFPIARWYDKVKAPTHDGACWSGMEYTVYQPLKNKIVLSTDFKNYGNNSKISKKCHLFHVNYFVRFYLHFFFEFSELFPK